MNMDRYPDDFFRRLCQRASVAILVTDSQLRVQLCNDSACRLLEVSCDQLVGQPIDQIAPQPRRRLVRRLLERSLRRGFGGELRLSMGAESARKELAAQVDVIVDEQDRATGLVLWIRDQTRHLQLERQFARSGQLVSIGRMAGGLAHHFNNILGGIVTAVDHALQVGDYPSSRRALELVAEAANKASQLTQQLLKLGSAGVADIDMVDLTEAVIAFIERVEPEVAKENISIDLDMREMPIIAVQSSKISQVLNALLDNSREALKDSGGGRITLMLESDEMEARLIFCDDGPGVAPAIAERIFEPFFTTKGALGAGGQSSVGLGLTVAQRLADEIGASLQYQPREGQRGACFVLSFLLKKIRGFERNVISSPC